MTTYDNQASSMPNIYDNEIKQDEGLVSVEYIKSIPGLLKAGEMLNCVIALICVSVWEAQGFLDGGGYASFVVLTSLIFTVIVYVVSIFRIIDKIRSALSICIPIEFFAYAGISLAYVIAAIVAAAYGSKHSSIAASCFFLFVGTALYGIETFFGFQRYRNRPRGGDNSQNKATNNVPMDSGPGPSY